MRDHLQSRQNKSTEADLATHYSISYMIMKHLQSEARTVAQLKAKAILAMIVYC